MVGGYEIHAVARLVLVVNRGRKRLLGSPRMGQRDQAFRCYSIMSVLEKGRVLSKRMALTGEQVAP